MIIGITGLKRSGKDTVAQYLVDEYDFIQYSFAKPLKLATCTMFGWDFDEVEKDENKEKVDPFWGISYRQVLQDLGTEWGQLGLCERFPEFGKITGRNLWVKRFQKFAEENKDKNIVISDMRFHHEATAIRELNGFTFRVNRSQINKDNHASEAQVQEMLVDYDIWNTRSLDILYKELKIIMGDILQ